MAFGKNKPAYAGGQLMDNVSSDVTTDTTTQVVFAVADADVWSLHLDWDDAGTTYAATVTLWASNRPDADIDTDTHWCQLDADHGWGGLPNGNPTGGDGRDFTDVGVSGALYYRLRVVSTAGAATLNCWLCQKRRK